MHQIVRRLGAVALSTTVLAGTASLAPAQAATATAAAKAHAAPNLYGADSARWLARQLTHGLAHNSQFKYDDYGLSLDIYVALKAIGTQPTAAASVITALAGDPGAYIGAKGEHYAGATGKLMTAVELAGRKPASFGGTDLTSTLEGLIDTTHPAERGRGVDRSAYGDYSNTIGQSWVVRALAGAHSSLARDAVHFLGQQQCSRGFFREDFEKATSTTSSFTCDGAAAGHAAPSVDSTALAVEALVAARAAGVTGLSNEIAKGSAWLAGQQRSDGAYVGNGAANTNTTGLAAAALALTGRTARAERSAAYLTRLQVTPATAGRYPRLVREVGAVAYNSPALAAGRKDGIPVDQRDQWRRATSQAAIGVLAVRPATVGVPHGYHAGGSRIGVSVSGLLPNETYVVRSAGTVLGRGTASSTGSARRVVTLPRAGRTYVLTVVGLRSARAGRAPVYVLGAKTFRLSLSHRPVRVGRVQRVTVSGLARTEPVRVYYRGQRIWSGTASRTGAVAHSFRVGRSTGKKRLVVRGRFDNRSATTSFRVVR